MVQEGGASAGLAGNNLPAKCNGDGRLFPFIYF